MFEVLLLPHLVAGAVSEAVKSLAAEEAKWLVARALSDAMRVIRKTRKAEHKAECKIKAAERAKEAEQLQEEEKAQAAERFRAAQSKKAAQAEYEAQRKAKAAEKSAKKKAKAKELRFPEKRFQAEDNKAAAEVLVTEELPEAGDKKAKTEVERDNYKPARFVGQTVAAIRREFERQLRSEREKQFEAFVLRQQRRLTTILSSFNKTEEQAEVQEFAEDVTASYDCADIAAEIAAALMSSEIISQMEMALFSGCGLEVQEQDNEAGEELQENEIQHEPEFEDAYSDMCSLMSEEEDERQDVRPQFEDSDDELCSLVTDDSDEEDERKDRVSVCSSDSSDFGGEEENEAFWEAEVVRVLEHFQQSMLILRGGGGGEGSGGEGGGGVKRKAEEALLDFEEDVEDLEEQEAEESETASAAVEAPKAEQSETALAAVEALKVDTKPQLKQYGLAKFWNPSDPASSKGALVLDLKPKKGRPRLAARTELLDQVAELKKQLLETNKISAEECLARKAQGLRNNPGGRNNRTDLLAASGEVSRRRMSGEKRIRTDLPAPTKLNMAREMKAALITFSHATEFWKAQQARYGCEREFLEGVLAGEDEWMKRCNELKLSQLPIVNGGGQAKGRRSKPKNLGVRKSGGGRKRTLEWAVAELSIYLNTERAYGVTVTQADLLAEYQAILSRESAKAQVREETEIKNRLERLSKSGTYRKSMTKRLVDWLGAKALAPHRVSQLSEYEEKVRAMLSWQSLDHAQQLAAFGTEQELSAFVAKPDQFAQHRDKCVLGFSDQIPLWVSEASKRVLYAEHEVATETQDKLRSRHMEMSLQEVQPATVVLAEHPKPSAEGQTQKRQQADANASKFRITYEARQILRNWFSKDPEVKPLAEVYKGAVIFPGVHCRISNISESGHWIRSESFSFKGKLVERKAGSSVGRIMSGFRELRTRRPELFSRLEIYQQPSANVDSVIFTWQQEELAASFVSSVFQRDCFAAAYTTDAGQAMFLSHCIPATVASKMTASLQLTDTDCSKTFKADCREINGRLRREFHERMRKAGLRDVFKGSTETFMEVLHQAQLRSEDRNAKSEWVLRGARRNLMLSWRRRHTLGCYSGMQFKIFERRFHIL